MVRPTDVFEYHLRLWIQKLYLPGGSDCCFLGLFFVGFDDNYKNIQYNHFTLKRTYNIDLTVVYQ